MESTATTRLASLMVFAIGSLWGFYWLPVREIALLGLQDLWGTVAIAAAGVLALAPFGLRRALLGADRLGLGSTALGGFAFVLYSVSFLYGDVAVVVILFFLTPVWSTVLGRLIMGWPITGLRVAVLVLGLLGLTTMLAAEGTVPIPRGRGEWLGLAAGFCWAVASIGLRVRPVPPAPQSGFIFALGALLGGLILAPFVSLPPDGAAITAPGQLVLWVGLTGGLWWATFTVGLMWAAPKLDPARVGILLMAEVLVAAVSAAILVGEHLEPLEWVGGGLVLFAGLIELWPERGPARRISRWSFGGRKRPR